MLVLSRNIGQQIILPETGVTVTVLAIQGKRVRIGVEAPRNISVLREEIYARRLGLNRSGLGPVIMEPIAFDSPVR